MRELGGFGIVILGLICTFSLLHHPNYGTLGPLGFFVISALAGCFILAYPSIEKLVVTGSGVQFEMKRAAEEVKAKAEEVRELVKGTEFLATAMQTTLRSIFESFVYTVNTRYMNPIPEAVRTRIEGHINRIGIFAYPNEEELRNVLERINADIGPQPR